MGKVLQCDGSVTGYSYVEQDLASTQADVWVTFRLAFTADALDWWKLGNGVALLDLLHFSNTDYVQISTDPPVWQNGYGLEGGHPVADVWQTLEHHYHEGVVSELYVNGILAFSSGAGLGAYSAQQFQFGLTGVVVGPANQLVYIDDVKIGTSRRGSDLFSDDFESGDLSAWTSTTGDVSVVDDPYASGEIVLTASDGDIGTYFGQAVAVSADGTTIVVGRYNAPAGGANRGAVYVYTGHDFAVETILTASDGADSDYFGLSVDVSDDGSTIVVGAFGADSYRGKVYVYDGADWATETILGNSGGADGDTFGTAVAISGDATTILIGATQQFGPTYQGRAYVCNGASWGTRVTLIPSADDANDSFGGSVALSVDGAVAVVGANGASSYRGNVYVYDGADWATETILSPGDSAGDQFGFSVDVSAEGTIIAVSELGWPSGTFHGRAFVYSGPGWASERLLIPPDLVDGGSYGGSIAISADGFTVAVGQPGYPDGAGGGRVVTFSGDDFATVRGGAGSDTIAGDFFGSQGHGVDVSGDGSTLVVGAPFRSGGDATGAAYVDPELAAILTAATGWTFELCDQVDVSLADITGLVTATISPRLNRPFSLVLRGPADQDVWKTIHTDGDPYLSVGIRTIKARREGVLMANVEIWRLDYTGDENSQTVQITCFDSMVRTACRVVRDDTGRLSEWEFTNPIIAGPFVQRLFENSVTFDDGTVPDGTPRLFPIDYESGDFSADCDVTDDYADGPLALGDMVYRTICDVGLADVMLTPTDTDAGSDPGIYGILNCVTHWGTDLSEVVHFDYDTGDNTIKAIRRSFDMATVTNRLRYLLAPKLRPSIWRGHLEATDPDLGTTHYRTIQEDSRAKYGTLQVFQVYDTNDASVIRELYRSLWKVEDTLRVNPRQLLYITPAGNCPFRPFADYNVGDRVTGNIGDNLGPAESGTMRIYGFDLTVDVDGIEEPGELIISPDGSGFPPS